MFVSPEKLLDHLNLELFLWIFLVSKLSHLVYYGGIGLAEYSLDIMDTEGRPGCIILYVLNV